MASAPEFLYPALLSRYIRSMSAAAHPPEFLGFRRSPLTVALWAVICAATALSALAFAVAAFGAALPLSVWSWDKVFFMGGWVFAALVSFQLSLSSFLSFAAYRRMRVALEPAALVLRLGNSPERRIEWSAIRRIAHTRTKTRPRADLYRLHADGLVIELTKTDCPSVREVAGRIALRLGVPIEEE